ncbi:hypothetical protein BpHYR1_011327 [Brachionus plicatilis]|uniref:Uncharacterized protein n=1 Tax=Brachionus plicatilis TaxID=10195 RepID=A0A3M7Q1M0_BRAPC|nr:hypothetical protein BpHYR1_011327 [Brachionus plicatilis]
MSNDFCLNWSESKSFRSLFQARRRAIERKHLDAIQVLVKCDYVAAVGGKPTQKTIWHADIQNALTNEK